MTQKIISDRTFGATQMAVLRSLAGLMIPAEADLPSAADPAIFAEIAARLGESAETVSEGLEAIASLGASPLGSGLSGSPTPEQQQIVTRLRAECPAFVARFEAAVVACYYRDDRVLRALGLPARAPYPEGNAVAPTDWSLLDPVRARPPFYRSVQP